VSKLGWQSLTRQREGTEGSPISIENGARDGENYKKTYTVHPKLF